MIVIATRQWQWWPGISYYSRMEFAILTTFVRETDDLCVIHTFLSLLRVYLTRWPGHTYMRHRCLSQLFPLSDAQPRCSTTLRYTTTMASTAYELKVWYYAPGYTKLPVPIVIDYRSTVGDLAKAISNELRELPGNFVLYKVSTRFMCPNEYA